MPTRQRICIVINSVWLLNGFQATVHTAATQQKYGDTLTGEKEPTTWAKRLSSDGFSPTLRAGSGNRTAARPIHYEHARVITVREAARLHSFPDWFDFGTSKLAAHKAIGNSVPPLLAYAIAQALTSQFASQVWTHLEEQQNISFGDSTRTTIVLRCPGTSCFVFRYLLDLATLEASVDLRLFYSMGQQSGKLNCGTSGLVYGDNLKVGNERSPPSNLWIAIHKLHHFLQTTVCKIGFIFLRSVQIRLPGMWDTKLTWKAQQIVMVLQTVTALSLRSQLHTSNDGFCSHFFTIVHTVC
jgi:hypothetical protein